MRVWDAFLGGMRTARTHPSRRIGAREAEALLTGAPTCPDRRELARLLSAAAGPAQPHELAGEGIAVAAFVHASRQPPAAKAGRTGPTLVRALTRAVVLKVAAGAAVLLVGGAALAAETGHLPDGAQRRAHEMFSSLGVPAPRGGERAGAGDQSSATPHGPGATPSTAGGARPDSASKGKNDPAIVRLCQEYVKLQKKPDGQTMDPAAFRALEAAAGGAVNVAAYCAKVLGEDRNAPSTNPTPGGRGKDHGRGTPPANPGQSRQPHPSPP